MNHNEIGGLSPAVLFFHPQRHDAVDFDKAKYGWQTTFTGTDAIAEDATLLLREPCRSFLHKRDWKGNSPPFRMSGKFCTLNLTWHGSERFSTCPMICFCPTCVNSCMTIKPFSEMTEGDYATLGFRSGLEIHQQLYTAKKLFCRCPAGHYSDDYNAEILRHMRPTLSELGEYDGTALMEFKTRKEIIYRIHRDTVCTYEMDDTPPFELNPEALDIALGVGLLFGCSMVDEIHVARKQYLDGSIPTGFQRTTIVGVDGSIPYKGRTIGIIQLGLEEDACREVSDVGHLRTYLTDRLGMPLIETVTAPDMRTPQEVAEVAEILRRLVRSTGKVRTGAGAARQDVNVSVSGGTRIEIKGVPRIPNIPLLTYNEAMRQHNLLQLRNELHRRSITKETFSSRTEEITKLLGKTRYQPIRNALDAGLIADCVLLRGFNGLLRWQTQTDTYFAREISDRVRVVACLTTLPNITHSDIPGETLASSEWQTIRKAVGGRPCTRPLIPSVSTTPPREVLIRILPCRILRILDSSKRWTVLSSPVFVNGT